MFKLKEKTDKMNSMTQAREIELGSSGPGQGIKPSKGSAYAR